MGEAGFHIDHKRNVITKAEFVASNKKEGMDLAELEKAINALRAQPMVSERGYKLRVVMGWKSQVQRLIFEESDKIKTKEVPGAPVTPKP